MQTFTFKRLFLSLTVHDNRVEIVEGMFPFRKKWSIPFRSIASVEVSRFTRRLIVKTNDGKEHQFAIGGFGKAQAVRDAIAERL